MPPDFHDSHDDSPDLIDWLHRLRQRGHPGGGHLGGSEWTPQEAPNQPQRGRTWVRAALGTMLLAVLAALSTALWTGTRGGDPPSVSPDTLYALRAVGVHSGAGREFAVIDTVARGERVLAHAAGNGRWMLLVDTRGKSLGFTYQSNTNFDARPPGGRTTRQPSSPQPQPLADMREAVADTTAICRDGTVSFSRNASGTCSWHGGVAQWINHPGTRRQD